MLSFIVDESLPRSTAQLLQRAGYDAPRVDKVGLRGAVDTDIFAYAQEEQRIIITRDRGFGNLLDYPLGTHCGVIVVDVPYFYTADQINTVIKTFITDADPAQLARALTIVEPGRYRIRQLQ